MDVTKDIDEKSYNIVVITYALSISTMAMIVDDLSIMFGMISVWCEICVDFVFPVFIFVYTSRSLYLRKPKTKAIMVPFVMIGVSYFVVGNYFIAKKINLVE